MNSKNDNIASIATPLQLSAISIIKISGFEIDKEINKIFGPKDVTKLKNNTITYGHIYDGDVKLDEVLLSIMRAPNSHTGEDIIEINTHGGVLITQKIMELVLSLNIRLAQPGEFSKRAFLNGKKTLMESENLINLMEAKNSKALELAVHSFSRQTEKLITKLREDLLSIVANIEVNIDYPEYDDINVVTLQEIESNIESYIEQIKKIIVDSEKGQLIKSGVSVAIVGRPNSGKSSLLNRLAREEKAIVTNVEGTTRDIVESSVNIGQLTLNLLDTAGIRETSDVVEQIGIKKSVESIQKADLIIFMVDGSKPIDDQTLAFYNNNIKDKKFVTVINKSDILYEPRVVNFENEIILSTLKDESMEELEAMILKVMKLEDFELSNALVLSNLNHMNNLRNVKDLLHVVQVGIQENQPIDMIEIDIKEALFNLGVILGIEVRDNLLDELFSRYCLGK